MLPREPGSFAHAQGAPKSKPVRGGLQRNTQSLGRLRATADIGSEDGHCLRGSRTMPAISPIVGVTPGYGEGVEGSVEDGTQEVTSDGGLGEDVRSNLCPPRMRQGVGTRDGAPDASAGVETAKARPATLDTGTAVALSTGGSSQGWCKWVRLHGRASAARTRETARESRSLLARANDAHAWRNNARRRDGAGSAPAAPFSSSGTSSSPSSGSPSSPSSTPSTSASSASLIEP
ncbi:uncharacterized protein LOC144702777 [Wolffia australiana]